ncbi:MAG: DNA-deoxyinosine glycosylase [Bacillus sp. (in: firmicutes)]
MFSVAVLHISNQEAIRLITSFQPIIDESSSILVVGSMPSVESLRKQQYYGNPRNHFWTIMYAIFKEPFEEDYKERVDFLLRHGIAVWDVIASCEREGSLDANIQNEVPNDIPLLLKSYPNIRKIVCNGTKAYQVFNRHFSSSICDVEVVKLPSTSPIPGRFNKTLEDKLVIWQSALS